MNRKEIYHEYLKSNHWKNKRNEVIGRYRQERCQICLKDSHMFNVHHFTYEKLGEERKKDLIPLCRDCHLLFHKFQKIYNISYNERHKNRCMYKALRLSRKLNYDERRIFINDFYNALSSKNRKLASEIRRSIGYKN